MLSIKVINSLNSHKVFEIQMSSPGYIFNSILNLSSRNMSAALIFARLQPATTLTDQKCLNICLWWSFHQHYAEILSSSMRNMHGSTDQVIIIMLSTNAKG